MCLLRHRLIPGLGRLLEKGVATHSSILAWRILWTEEPGGLQSMGSQRVGQTEAAYICVCVHAQPCPTPQTAASQAPLSMGFPRQEYCSGLPFPPPGARLDPGIEPASLAPPALAGRFFTMSTTWEASGE